MMAAAASVAGPATCRECGGSSEHFQDMGAFLSHQTKCVLRRHVYVAASVALDSVAGEPPPQEDDEEDEEEEESEGEEDVSVQHGRATPASATSSDDLAHRPASPDPPQPAVPPSSPSPPPLPPHGFATDWDWRVTKLLANTPSLSKGVMQRILDILPFAATSVKSLLLQVDELPGISFDTHKVSIAIISDSLRYYRCLQR